MAQFRKKLDGVDAFWTDDWNGYPANRKRLLQRIHDRKVPNPVVVSGDIHSFFANDLKLDSYDLSRPRSRPNSSAHRFRLMVRPTIPSRRRCRTILTFIFSKAGGAATSLPTSCRITCKCRCASSPTRTIRRPASALSRPLPLEAATPASLPRNLSRERAGQVSRQALLFAAMLRRRRARRRSRH